MEKDNFSDQYQKYLPFILVAVTVLFGGYLLLQRGVFKLSFFSLNNKSNSDSRLDTSKSSVVDIPFTGKELKLSYSNMPAASLVNIAKFGEDEQWQGAGSIEENRKLGRKVMSLIDRDRKKAISFLIKDLDLSKVDNIKFAVNLQSDPDDVESLNLLFGNKKGNSYFRFPITHLKSKMNYFSIPKYRFFLENAKGSVKSPVLTWSKIERVQIELISRPASKAAVEIDWIRGEKGEVFTSDWMWKGTDYFLNLDRRADGKPTLLAQNSEGSVAILRKITSAENFSFSAKIISLKKGSLGLFFRGDYKTGYGYYLVVEGVNTNTWSISKFGLADKKKKPKTTLLIGGQINNFEFIKGEPFWLKVIADGNTITGFFSLDGKKYTKLGEAKDDQFNAGGVGISVANGAVGYFDDFNFMKK